MRSSLVEYSSNMNTPHRDAQPILSVITPISKMAGRLENLTNWLTEISNYQVQVIIVHDRQDDLTGPELNQLLSELGNSNIEIIHKFCGSPGTARNLGLTHATAEWICFWDSDDQPRVPEFLEMVDKASKNESEYCIGSYAEVTPNTVVNHPLNETHIFDPVALLKNPGIWRMAFNRRFIGAAKFAESRMAEDQFFLCGLNFSDSKSYIFHQTVYEYHRNFGSQLTKNKNALSDIPKVMRLLFNLRASVSSAGQIDFINSVIARVSIAGIKRASLKTKIEITRCLFNKNHLDKRKIVFKAANISIIKIIHSSSFSKPPSLRVKLYGGLGNQLFQLAAGLTIAGNRKLTLEVDLNASDGAIKNLVLPDGVDLKILDSRTKRARIFLRLCNLNLRQSTYSNPNFRKRTIRSLSVGLLTILLSIRDRAKVTILRPKGLGYSEVASPARHQFLIGYMQSYVWSENLAIQNQLSEIRPQKRNPKLDSTLKELRSTKVLGVHVRLGDYSTNQHFGRLGEEYYRRAVQESMEKSDFNSIWVFSNEIETAQSHLKFLDELEQSVTWVDDSFLSSAELLFLISNCTGIVLANSSFSWWAARLNRNARPLLVAPRPWFSEIDSPKLLIPDDWNQVDSLFKS